MKNMCRVNTLKKCVSEPKTLILSTSRLMMFCLKKKDKKNVLYQSFSTGPIQSQIHYSSLKYYLVRIPGKKISSRGNPLQSFLYRQKNRSSKHHFHLCWLSTRNQLLEGSTCKLGLQICLNKSAPISNSLGEIFFPAKSILKQQMEFLLSF